MKKSGAKLIAFEGPCLVCRVRRSEKLSDLSAVDRVETAKQVPGGFSDVTAAIVEVATKTIMPCEKFYIRAILAAKADYVERDIEFASAGALVEKLAKLKTLPARTEQQADRVILAIVTRESAYVGVRGKT